MLRIGPSGNSVTFYNSGLKHTYQAAKWLNGIGLNAFEYSFGRGVRISLDTASKIKQEFNEYDVALSVHAPYYTNFSNESPEMIQNSIGYVIQSLQAVHIMGGNRVVFHPATCGKLDRAVAVNIAKDNISKLMQEIHQTLDSEFTDYIVCPETMGKMQQIGRVEEIIEFCKLDDALYPCYDFGHINSYLQGGLKTKDDYRRIIDLTAKELGDKKTNNMHIHFSKIQYSAGGEVRHLDFSDTTYGPDYEPLAMVIDEYNLTPTIICESRDFMSDDALFMKKLHKNI